MAANSIRKTRGPLRLALATALLVWTIASLAATSEENRTTWLLFALIALAGRLAMEAPDSLTASIPDAQQRPPSAIIQPAFEPAFAALQLTGFHAEMAVSAGSGRAQHSRTHMESGAPGPSQLGTGDCADVWCTNAENALDEPCPPWHEEIAARRCRRVAEDHAESAESRIADAANETQPEYPAPIAIGQSPVSIQAATEDRNAALAFGVLAILAVGISVASARARTEVLRLPEH